MGAMGFYLRLGDATTCGGRILTGDETLSWYGVAGAREGDAVACGKHPGVYKILGGTSDTWDEGRRLAGTLDSVSSCPCCARFIPSIHDCYFKEDTSEEQAEEERLLSVAALAVKEKEPATKEKRLTEEQNQNRVFAKSRLREAGNTDAGTEDEPQSNFAAMSFYQSSPSQPAPEPEQYAQAAKKKRTSPPLPSEPPKEKSWFDKITGFFFGDAEAMPLPPPPVVMGGSAEAGMAAAAGGATAKANQDAAKALTHTMRHLSGPEIWNGSLAMSLPFVVMGAIVQSKLKGEKSDLLTPDKLLEVAHSKGTVPTRVRYNWITEDETGRLKAVGYHTSTESGRDRVRVRMLEKQRDGSYEFWSDDQSDKPLITWTPASTPGSQDSWNTGNNSPQVGTVTIPGLEHPDIHGVTITTTPVPEEKDFRDYILVFPGNVHPPIYIYLSKPPVELLEVELYSDFKGRSRQGKYEADHMPSRAAVEQLLMDEHPGLDQKLIGKMADRVAAIVVPKEVHQKISQTYGGRNTPDQIVRDAKNLRSALERNFDAIKPALKECGATEEQLESARAKMHKLNSEQGLY